MEETKIEKHQVEGIILVLSCQKHKNTRLKEFNLKKDEYNGWKVIYILGDLFIEKDYIIDNNIITIKCEDSYIHLLKKLVLAIKYVNELFDIKHGILRSGDDLLFNEQLLYPFLNDYKPDYYGYSGAERDCININIEELKKTKYDDYMVKYYLNHPEDFNNPLHNLKNIDISKYMKRPITDVGAGGNLYYISNKCCNILVDHMEKINYNIFHFDEFSQSYPYTIEDCAVSFILYLNRIDFICSPFISWSHDINNLKYHVAISTDRYK
jgi:hypothetical protein